MCAGSKSEDDKAKAEDQSGHAREWDATPAERQDDDRNSSRPPGIVLIESFIPRVWLSRQLLAAPRSQHRAHPAHRRRRRSPKRQRRTLRLRPHRGNLLQTRGESRRSRPHLRPGGRHHGSLACMGCGRIAFTLTALSSRAKSRDPRLLLTMLNRLSIRFPAVLSIMYSLAQSPAFS